MWSRESFYKNVAFVDVTAVMKRSFVFPDIHQSVSAAAGERSPRFNLAWAASLRRLPQKPLGETASRKTGTGRKKAAAPLRLACTDETAGKRSNVATRRREEERMSTALSRLCLDVGI